MLGHHWQQDGCLDRHLGDKNANMSQDGAQGVAKLSQDGILASEFVGGHFERCWLEVGLSWVMLELCCDISGAKMGAKMSQDGAQEVAKLS